MQHKILDEHGQSHGRHTIKGACRNESITGTVVSRKSTVNSRLSSVIIHKPVKCNMQHATCNMLSAFVMKRRLEEWNIWKEGVAWKRRAGKPESSAYVLCFLARGWILYTCSVGPGIIQDRYNDIIISSLNLLKYSWLGKIYPEVNNDIFQQKFNKVLSAK